MRNYFIAGNWKMHKTVSESVALAKELKAKLAGSKEKIMEKIRVQAQDSVTQVTQVGNVMKQIRQGAESVVTAIQQVTNEKDI